MNIHAGKKEENKSQTTANTISKKKNNTESVSQLVDNRAEAVAQRKLQETANNSADVKQLISYQERADNFTSQITQRKENTEEEILQGKFESIQKKENNTGLPDNLKTGIENLSGYSMNDVKVHYNSDKPAQLQAHAYAQGTDIHLGSGQEKHLPHEAWHVVQQKQGRVKPTIMMKGKVGINDDTGLEQEADVMGEKAIQMNRNSEVSKLQFSNTLNREVTQRMVQIGKKNITRSSFDDAVKKAILESLVPADLLRNDGGKKVLKAKGIEKATTLFEKYSSITIFLNDENSLTKQVGQDLYLLHTDNTTLVGIPHQHSEYATDSTKRNLAHKTNDMRVYRAMPLFAWEQASLWGHGGSLGEAMHYFEVYKRETNRNPANVYVLVQFTIKGKTINDMIGNIGSGGEGAKSNEGDASKFGGKKESTTAFGIDEDFFSVDLKHAQTIINSDNVSTKVMASTGDMPERTTKPGSHWT